MPAAGLMATRPQTDSHSNSISVADANEHALILGMCVAAIAVGALVAAVAAAISADLLTLISPVRSAFATTLEVGLAGLGLLTLGGTVLIQEWRAFP